VKKKNTDIIFMDIRSEDEFKKAHVKNAISVPFYSLKNDFIEYKDIPKTIHTIKIEKTKLIIIYGPSTSFQYQRTVVSKLIASGFNAQLLAVGWNELRHFQNIWIPEGLWGKIDINTVIMTNDPQ
jgi:rhodanese-related sulfurtransferase